MMNYGKKLAGLMLIGMMVMTGSQSFADRPEGRSGKSPRFEKRNPRQAQVFRVTRHERRRVHRLYKEGRITLQQRDQMLKEVRNIRRQQTLDARALNQEMRAEARVKKNRRK